MTDSQVKVTVVIPVYNQGSFLSAAIDSVLEQGGPATELVVVDDGSTDHTRAVIQSYGSQLHPIFQSNHGAAHALNEGIRAGSGELVCWLSADDKFLPGKIAAQSRRFAERPELAVSCTASRLVDEHDRLLKPVSAPVWRHPDPFLAVFWGNPINGSSVMIRRDVFEAMGGFDESLRADVDGAMWLKCSSMGHAFEQIDTALVEYRIHRNTLSADRTLMRESMTRVRMPYIQDGTLERRARELSAAPADLLARMARDFAWWGFRDLSRAVLDASRHIGPARGAQAQAAAAILATSSRRLHEAVRRTGGAARRRWWARAARRG